MNEKDSILQPVLNDRALIALMRLRFVPLAFIQQKCGIKSTRKSITDLINAFEKIKNSTSVNGDDYSISFVGANPQFQIIKKAIHVSIGIDVTKSSSSILTSQELIDLIKKKAVSLDAPIRDSATAFKSDTYTPLVKQIEKYERILKDCNKSLDLETALKRSNTDMATWRRIKSNMARYGLSKDLRFARNVTIQGSLYDEVEKHFFGQNIAEVFDLLLRKGLEQNT